MTIIVKKNEKCKFCQKIVQFCNVEALRNIPLHLVLYSNLFLNHRDVPEALEARKT